MRIPAEVEKFHRLGVAYTVAAQSLRMSSRIVGRMYSALSLRAADRAEQERNMAASNHGVACRSCGVTSNLGMSYDDPDGSVNRVYDRLIDHETVPRMGACLPEWALPDNSPGVPPAAVYAHPAAKAAK